MRHALTAGITIVFLAVGLYPYQWQLPWVSFENGLYYSPDGEMRFERPGIAYTKQPEHRLVETQGLPSLHIRLEVMSYRKDQHGPARILTISKNTELANLVIGQNGSDLVIRIPSPDPVHMRTFKLKQLFAVQAWRQIDVEFSTHRFSVVVDGVERLAEHLPPNSIYYWSENYKLAFGNELTYNRPWLGAIRRAEISTHGLHTDYAQPGTLYAPKRLTFYRAKIHSTPFAGDRATSQRTTDWLVNFFGFIPYGFWILAAGNGRRTLMTATMACAALSISIEIGQLFLAYRVTSNEDLILNIAGGTLGAWLATRYRAV